MAESFGVSFAPTDQNTQNPLAKPGGANPVQTAIQMLSLRLPKVLGAQAVTPGPLLQSPGSAGLDPQMLLQLIRGMFPGIGGGVSPAAPDAPGAPPININAPLPHIGLQAPTQPTPGMPTRPVQGRPDPMNPTGPMPIGGGFRVPRGMF